MLELGSIVYLKDGVEKVMILNRGSIIEENKDEYKKGVVPTESKK